MSENKSSRFEEWEEVKDCNKCSNYWNDICDGVKVDTEKPCRDFKATRRMDIPEQIESLKESNRRMRKAGIINSICILLLALSHFISRWLS